jgi:hypothetical protein
MKFVNMRQVRLEIFPAKRFGLKLNYITKTQRCPFSDILKRWLKYTYSMLLHRGLKLFPVFLKVMFSDLTLFSITPQIKRLSTEGGGESTFRK